MNQSKNEFSHFTAMERSALSYPARFLAERYLLRGKVLDFGCGLGKDVEILQQRSFDIVGYDPHYFPNYPNQKFDTILCFYVLNVLMEQEQARVLMEISRLLKPSGRAYFAVRRDLKKEGFRQHYVHKVPTYQCTVTLPFTSLKVDSAREIYEYTHYNQQRHSSRRCIFCNPRKNLTLLAESATSYAMLDGYPLSKGHALVIPKRHISNFFKLEIEEQFDCWLMANRVQEIIMQEFRPNGFNVGTNINRASGQRVMHTNIHIIPRYKGDAKGHKRKGGMRLVIPPALEE